MALVYGSRAHADIRAVSVRGAPGLGFHRLTFHLEFHANASWTGSLVVLGLTGTARASGAGRMAELGRLSGPAQLTLVPDMRTVVAMDLDAAPQSLAAIEDLRCGKRVQFDLSVTGSMWNGEGLPQPFQDRLSGPEINRESWLQVLEECEFARTLVLEVPLEAPSGTDTEAKDLQFLQQAHHALQLGNWRESVGLCRDVLEHLPIAIRESKEPTNESKLRDQLKGSREWDKAERFRAARHALMVVAHAARHADEIAARIDWDRKDAQNVLAMTVALVAHARGGRPGTA